MRPTIRENLLDDKLCHHFDLGLIQQVIPRERVEDLLQKHQAWEQRERSLNMMTIVYWLIAQHLYPELSQRSVYSKVVSGLRLWCADFAEQMPAKSALSYRKKQLGLVPMQDLFTQLAGPQATAQTSGAFWKGMRLLALDSTVDSVPDTESNREAFRYSSDDEVSRSPFPQVRLLLLIECATHLICDAQISSCRQGELTSTRPLLQRALQAGTLLLWDSGFLCSDLFFRAKERQAHLLGRLKSNVLCKPVQRLSDGSYLTYVYQDQDHQRGERLQVRVITYTFTDERIPGAGSQTYRLVTTLLDPQLYPAKELAVLYHERWHVELVIDEAKTHLRLSARTLRSLTPEGIKQEIYALLVAHIAVRTLMLHAADAAGVAPTQLSFTQTVRIIDESLQPLWHACPTHRLMMINSLLQEIAQQRLPIQRLRLQARVVKRVRSRYERKKACHLHAPPLEIDLDFHTLIELLT